MKKLLVIALMLVGFMVQAQNYLLKEYYQIQPSGDTLWNSKYTYNEDFTIDSISGYLGNELRSVSYYENDTALFTRNALGSTIYRYDYYDDSITTTHIYNGNEYHSYTYHLDQQDRIVWIVFKEEDPFITDIFNVWDGENISEYSYVTYNDTVTQTATYHDYINPKYNAAKYFGSDFSGCYNLVKSFFNSDGEEVTTYEVVESIADYPIKVEHYNYGELYASYHYIYHIIDDVQEIPSESHTVLAVDYYDLMGRQIPKPNKGFYIKREVTNKGVFSTKHYIQ